MLTICAKYVNMFDLHTVSFNNLNLQNYNTMLYKLQEMIHSFQEVKMYP